MKSIFFITARLPFPESSGRKVSLYNYCKILHNIYKYDIYVYSFLEEGDDVNIKPDFIKEVKILPNINLFTKLINIIKYTYIKKDFPLQVSLYYSPQIKEFITRELSRINPDVLIADMVRTTEYGIGFKGKKIADLDDLLSIRYERQLSQDLSIINPYGAYSSSLPSLVKKILSFKFIKYNILKFETALLKSYEVNISRKYDNVVLVGKDEVNKLNGIIEQKNAVDVPICVQTDYYGEYYFDGVVNSKDIVFLGALQVAHNEVAVMNFIDNIFPIVKKQIPDARFVIVGGGASDKLLSMANESIIFTGRVDDLRPILSQARVFVCPLTFGSGIKTKNLEAMAIGIPIVTTTIGAENINAKRGHEWLVEDSPTLFAKKVIEVMRDDDLYIRLKESAFSFVNKCWTWREAEKKWGVVLGERLLD